MTKTTATVLIIVAIVVSAVVVAISLYQKQLLDWWNINVMNKPPILTGGNQRMPTQRSYNINEVADSIASGHPNLQ